MIPPSFKSPRVRDNQNDKGTLESYSGVLSGVEGFRSIVLFPSLLLFKREIDHSSDEFFLIYCEL